MSLPWVLHEIEHPTTSRNDDALNTRFQASGLIFNDAVKNFINQKFALEKRLSIALQFTFGGTQHQSLASADLPPAIETTINSFHKNLSEQEQVDPKLVDRATFVQKAGNRTSTSDLAVEFIKPGSDEKKDIHRILMKAVKRKRDNSSEIIKLMQKEGFPKFKMRRHTSLSKELDTNNPANGFGCKGEPYLKESGF